MKNKLLAGIVFVLIAANVLAVSTQYTQKQVRDPRQLETILETNAGNPGVSTNYVQVGTFQILSGTQLVFMAGSVTNVIDADITSP